MRQRTKLIAAVLESNNAVPLNKIIELTPDGIMLVNGKPVEYEHMINIRDGARAMLNNPARIVVRDEVAAIAGTRGVVEGDTPEKLYFYRAALWVSLTEEEMYKKLSQL